MSFHDVRLPARLAFGSTGGVERRTEIVTLGSGYERRSTPWAQGRRRYLIGANLRSLDDMAALTEFFEARRGRLYGFRFRDFADFKSCAPGAVVPEVGGRQVSWRARSRLDGDRWDGEAAGADPLRFRVRVLAGEAERREAVVEGEGWTYAAGELATDFPGGVGAEATLAVAQWGEGYGWGEEARVGLR